MEELMRLVDSALGLGADSKDLTAFQVSARGLLVFVAALVMIRLSDKRFLSRKTAFDVILGFIMASMLARAVNGSAPFWPTLIGGFVLVGFHRLLANLSRHSSRFGQLVKGRSDLVIEAGRLNEEAARRNNFSPDDVREDLRLNGVENIADVRLAYIERNGEMSVVKR